jgi:hypothetical protein
MKKLEMAARYKLFPVFVKHPKKRLVDRKLDYLRLLF